MTRLNACTIVSKNYLPFARVLAQSFAQRHPGGRFFTLLVDRVDGYFDPAEEPFEVLEAHQLDNVPDLPGFLFKYTILESNTAIKPYLLQYLLETFDLPNLVYFDPDIQILGSLDPLTEVLERSSMVLTPHLDTPIEDEFHPGEQAILQSGAYNLGFLALKRGDETSRLLDWWQSRLYDQCVVKIDQGLFVDQKWMDLAPSLFDDVTILRDKGYNVAYWNLHSRSVRQDGREYRVGDRPLVFFHYSGIEPESLDGVSKHQDRFRLSQIGAAADLYRAYAEALFSAGFRECRTWPFAYGAFDNGAKIPDSVRRMYLDLPLERRKAFGDPFQTEGVDSFWNWLNRPRRGGNGRGLSRFVYDLYLARPDIARRFPDPGGRDLDGFATWMHEYGRFEFDLDSAFLDSLPTPEAASSLSQQGLEDRLRRVYRSELAAGVKQRAKRLLGPARTARLKDRLRRGDGPGFSHATDEPTWTPPLITSIDRPGINLVGYLQAETGMGEAARSLARALQAADIPHSLHSLDLNVLAPNRDQSFEPQVSEFPYDINLFVVNADQVPPVFDVLGPEVFAGRFNVGLWLWELSRLTPSLARSFRYLHEVWTPSTFCVDAFGAISPNPVRRLPLPVVAGPAPFGRDHFGLPADDFTFLFMFNYLSYFERKNPLALVEAFQRAFPSPSGVRLVLKTSHAEFAPDLEQRLKSAVGNSPITLLDGYLAGDEVSSLVASCDAYVSLHRSEGYGLTLAEAMAHGKPVIATAYSGNMDFFGVSNGFPVRYDLVEIASDTGPYPAGAEWADPSVEHAAELMRRVVGQPEAAAAVGAHAARDIAHQLSEAAVGCQLRERFDGILDRIRSRSKSTPT
ncbi:MAG: glycosyltransferase family 4 protein [Thermoanaerobaculia bacterium]|nr:glycosyltransferase family 4 protein [Thermoanaerobaculia bacterium]